MVWRQELLEGIDLGKSVAEQDENLNSYYVDNHVYQEVTEDQIDIVRGQKGSGKSAILKRLLSKGIPGVRIKTAENLSGDLVFRQVFALAFVHPDKLPSEQILADAWKIYFLSVALDEVEDHISQNAIWPKRVWYNVKHMRPLKNQLKKYRILINSKDLETKLRIAISRIGVQVKDPAGNSYDPYIDVRMSAGPAETGIPFNLMYQKVDEILREIGISVWVCLDKLDEAFQNLDDKVEYAALRSLLTAYKDVMHHQYLKIKIFIREDIFNRVTYQGFTALTHIRPRTSSAISWDKDKLLHLLVERIMFPQKVRSMLREIGRDPASNSDERLALLKVLLPPQIDAGKESDTFTWIVNRVKDGTGISTPRDVIDLATNAKWKQLELWKLNSPEGDGRIIIEPSAFKAALKQLSKDKLTTHLYAEHPSLKRVIEKFRDRKAEYDEPSLKEILGEDFPHVKDLVEVGFFEVKERKSGKTWWVPFVYRDGLGITQGKLIRGTIYDDDTEPMV